MDDKGRRERGQGRETAERVIEGERVVVVGITIGARPALAFFSPQRMTKRLQFCWRAWTKLLDISGYPMGVHRADKGKLSACDFTTAL